MSVAAAIEQLPPDTMVEGAVMRRWIDVGADALAERCGIVWTSGEDELGTARYTILRRKARSAAPMVLVSYDDSPGIDVLASDHTSDGEIDALLLELDVQSNTTSSDPPSATDETTRALETRVTLLEEKAGIRQPKRRSVAQLKVLDAVQKSPGITVRELAEMLAVQPVPIANQLSKLRDAGLIVYEAERWYPYGAARGRRRRQSAAPQSRRSA